MRIGRTWYPCAHPLPGLGRQGWDPRKRCELTFFFLFSFPFSLLSGVASLGETSAPGSDQPAAVEAATHDVQREVEKAFAPRKTLRGSV